MQKDWGHRCAHPQTSWLALSVSAVSVSDEARAEVNGLKASRYFSLAERLNVGAAPFIWLFIRPPWSVSGSCCKAVVHESLRAECQLQKVSPCTGCGWGTPQGPRRGDDPEGRCCGLREVRDLRAAEAPETT